MPFAKTLLIYMNCILHNDENSIDCIGDGDFIIIIENLYYLDDTYYNSLNNINYSGKKKCCCGNKWKKEKCDCSFRY